MVGVLKRVTAPCWLLLVVAVGHVTLVRQRERFTNMKVERTAGTGRRGDPDTRTLARL